MKQFWVYMLASKPNGTLYIGVTSDIAKRTRQHKSDAVENFTKKYQVHQLVYLEPQENPEAAITREKQLKAWKRDWKIRLIEEKNPHWEDLYPSVASSL
jgi:putative endonuclease